MELISNLLNVDTQEVGHFTFISDAKLSTLDLLQHLRELCFTGTGKDGVVSVKDIHALALVEHTLIKVGTLKTNAP